MGRRQGGEQEEWERKSIKLWWAFVAIRVYEVYCRVHRSRTVKRSTMNTNQTEKGCQTNKLEIWTTTRNSAWEEEEQLSKSTTIKAFSLLWIHAIPFPLELCACTTVQSLRNKTAQHIEKCLWWKAQVRHKSEQRIVMKFIHYCTRRREKWEKLFWFLSSSRRINMSSEP